MRTGTIEFTRMAASGTWVVGAALAALTGCRGPAPGPAVDSATGGAPTVQPVPEPALAPEEGALEAASGLEQPPQPAAGTPGGAAPRDQAASAIAAGDYASAREAIDDLLAGPHLEAATQALREGRLVDALAAAEAAVEQAPTHVPSLLVKASCEVALADRTGESRRLVDALDTLRLAGPCAPALGRASRLARRLGRSDDALELARRGAALSQNAAWTQADALASRAWPSEPIERTLAEAALDAWRQRGGADAPEAEALFAEAEDALALRLADAGDDPWAWITLSEAYLEARRPAEARAALERGTDKLPWEGRLYENLARAARDIGGTREVVRSFERQQRRHPAVGLAWWYPAIELFRDAVERLPATRTVFVESARAFQRCRVRDETLAAACLRYEALCLTGQGWCRLAGDDLFRAAREFRAAEGRLAGALQLEIEGRLPSAARGLQRVVDLHVARSELQPAAELSAYLWSRAGPDERLARQAARLQRELGDLLQLESSDFRLASRGRLDDPQRLVELRAQIGIVRPGDDLIGTGREADLLREAASRRARAAREAYRASLDSQRVVIELAPEDLRARCNAAALAVQRLGTDLEWAEQQLMRCVERGAQRLEQGLDDEQQRFALRETWGDAHQLLGILYLERRDDPRGARRWFERSLEIGPLPRPEVADHYLPRCLEAGR